MKRLVAFLFAAILAAAVPATAFAGTLTTGGIAATDTKSALQIALKDAGLKKSQVTKIEVESKKNSIEVEFTKKKGKTEYSYDVSAKNGTILEKEVEYAYKHNASKAKIGKKAALKKVAKFAKFKQSVVKGAKCKYTYKKGEGTYKITFRHGGYKYEYEMLAPTGKIIEWDMERI